MASLVVAFFVAALLYASVGFGGGSTYTALLALAEIDYRLLPLLSLACNIVVVAGSSCLLYTSPSPRDRTRSRMPSSA